MTVWVLLTALFIGTLGYQPHNEVQEFMAPKKIDLVELEKLGVTQAAMGENHRCEVVSASGILFQSVTRESAILFVLLRCREGRDPSEEDEISCILSVVKRNGQEGWRSAYREAYSEEYLAGSMQSIEVANRRVQCVAAVLWYTGSTYAATKNVILVNADRVQEWSFDTPRGPCRVDDIDGDGVDEIIVQVSVYEGNVPIPGIYWEDIYRYGDGTFKKRNEEYPQFYRTLIESVYRQKLTEVNENPQSYFGWQETVDVLNKLIRSAERIAEGKKPLQ